MAALPYYFARMIRGCREGLDEHTITGLRHLRPIYERLFRVANYFGAREK
jgi:hypothetical protein